MINKLIIIGACVTIILLFQNCAKNPNLNLNSQTSASMSPTPNLSACSQTAAPQFQATPQNVSVTAGQPVNVTVAVSPTNNLTFAWQLNGVGINDTTNTLSIASATSADSGQYTLTVSSPCYPSINTSFTVTVSAPAAAVAAPVITSAPANVAGVYNVNLNQFLVPADTTSPFNTVTFSVAATGANLAYQWYHIDSSGTVSAITGATQPTYTFNLNSFGEGGTYKVVVSNSGGSTSAQAQLTVTLRNITTTRCNLQQRGMRIADCYLP